MKKLFGTACLLWITAAHAQGTEMPVTPAKPLTLQEAWTLAEQNSVSLKSARAAVVAAEGHAEDTRGLLWNNPELNAEGVRRQLPPSEIGTTTNREWGAGITQALEIGGQHGHRREAARQELIAAQMLAQVAERDVRADVERRFVQVLALQARIGIERDSLTLIERTSSFARRRVAAGEDSRLEGNVALIEAGRARNQLAALTDQLLQARVELGELLQWPSATLPDVVGDLEAKATVPALDRLLEMAAERSQVKALQAKEAAARSKLDLELAARIPDITVGLGVGREGPQDFRESPPSPHAAGSGSVYSRPLRDSGRAIPRSRPSRLSPDPGAALSLPRAQLDTPLGRTAPGIGLKHFRVSLHRHGPGVDIRPVAETTQPRQLESQ